MNKILRVIFYSLLSIYTAIMLYPFLWMIVSAMKTSYEFFIQPWALPQTIQWGNFLKAWDAGIKQFFVNSMLVTAISVAGIVFLSSLAAYAFARLHFRGKIVLFLFVVSGFLIPAQVTLIPLYSTLREIGIIDSYLAMIGPYIAFGIPFSVLLLTEYFRSIPIELEDAARIDGCNEVQIYKKIIMPLAKVGLSTIVIFQGVWIWNEFLFALVFIQSKSLMTLPLGLMLFQGVYIRDWTTTLAGISIATLPLVMVYILFQKNFVRGITAGAVKM